MFQRGSKYFKDRGGANISKYLDWGGPLLEGSKSVVTSPIGKYLFFVLQIFLISVVSFFGVAVSGRSTVLLCLSPPPLTHCCVCPLHCSIFGYEGSAAEDIVYVKWLNMVRAGLLQALQFYSPETKKWRQARNKINNI